MEVDSSSRTKETDGADKDDVTQSGALDHEPHNVRWRTSLPSVDELTTLRALATSEVVMLVVNEKRWAFSAYRLAEGSVVNYGR